MLALGPYARAATIWNVELRRPTELWERRHRGCTFAR